MLLVLLNALRVDSELSHLVVIILLAVRLLVSIYRTWCSLLLIILGSREELLFCLVGLSINYAGRHRREILVPHSNSLSWQNLVKMNGIQLHVQTTSIVLFPCNWVLVWRLTLIDLSVVLVSVLMRQDLLLRVVNYPCLPLVLINSWDGPLSFYWSSIDSWWIILGFKSHLHLVLNLILWTLYALSFELRRLVSWASKLFKLWAWRASSYYARWGQYATKLLLCGVKRVAKVRLRILLEEVVLVARCDNLHRHSTILWPS